MRRVETYVGSQVYEWLDSSQAQNTMTAIAKVCAALFGTNVLANGLACTPTSPATLTVQIGPGELYSMQSLEATACGTLPANTTNTILKQGIQLGTFTTGTLAAPLTTGQSINYLIEAQYQDSDISLDPTTGAAPVVLQFYNSSSPTTPWSGPNNSGASSNTFRDGIIAYQVKTGTAAATGSQVTPTPDSGWTGLWVVTVPYAATTISSGNIASYSAAPILPSGVLQSVISGNLTYGIDNGTANVIQATFPVPITTLVDNMELWVKVKTANTGASTFTPNPGVISPSPVVGAAHAALQGGEYIASGRALHVWRADISSWVLVECTGAAEQVAPATASQHAMQLGQATGRLLNIRTITSTQTYTATAGTNNCFVRVQGGGAAGGGCGGTGAGQVAAAGGGSAGGTAESYLAVASINGLTATVGAGGTGSVNAPGGNGGSSSIGPLSATGGTGGTIGSPITTPSGTSLAGGSAGGVGSGGNLRNSQGGYGTYGAQAPTPIGGAGGASAYGSGAVYVSGTSNGVAASSPGSGGSGGSCLSSIGGGATGGAGKAGIIEIWEFA